MVLKPTSPQQAKVTSDAIKKFRTRQRHLELELACLKGMISELEKVLHEYLEERNGW